MSPNHALRSAVYETVKAAGPGGLRYAQVHARLLVAYPEVTPKAVHGHLSRLADAELITRGGRGHYLTDEACKEPGGRVVSPQERLLELIADCPGGVSDALLAEEAGMSRWRVGRYLMPFVAEGALRRVVMPSSHGGGWGYECAAPPPVRAAAEATIKGATMTCATADEAGRDSAAGRAAEDAQYEEDGTFELLVASGRLAIAWDRACIVLPPAVTRGLLRYLGAQGATS